MGRLPENHPTFSYLSNEPYFKGWTERQKSSNDQLMETKKMLELCMMDGLKSGWCRLDLEAGTISLLLIAA